MRLLAPLRGEDFFGSVELVLVPALFLDEHIASEHQAVPALSPRHWAGLARLSRTPAWLLAMRHLARQWQAYATPVLLMTASLSLGAYTLSMASSLDRWLADRISYRVGADLAFSLSRDTASGVRMGGQPGPIGGGWIPPVTSSRPLPGAQAATRIGRYTPEDRSLGSHVDATATEGQSLAVDRTDLGQRDVVPPGLRRCHA